MTQDLKVKQFHAGSCYSYILSSGKNAFVIDPHISLMEEYEKYLKARGLSLEYVVDTHTHADHFSLANILKSKFGLPVLMHEKAVSDVADRRLKEGDIISIGEARFNIRYAPGHTDDTINIYGEGRLFTGDVLLIGSVGRTDFQNGSPGSMFDTLQSIKKLPDDTVIFPAHDYNGKRSSTLAREKKTNPFLIETDRDKFINNARSKKLPKPFNIENIIRVNQKGEAAALETVTPGKAFDSVSSDDRVKLLDVRSASEYADVHIKGSVNMPIETLASKLEELSGSGEEYIVFCRTGNRSPMAADILLQGGVRSVKVMEGGIQRWEKEKRPVEKVNGGISIERQIRIIAGSLVLLGIIFSRTISPIFIFLPIAVSCGLIFAGVTDKCMMASVLLRLPYNKKAYRAKMGGGTCSISQ